MALIIKTSNPSGLLQKIRSAIDYTTVRTWYCDRNGNFTNTLNQWKNRAWLKPSVSVNELRFDIFQLHGTTIPRDIYGLYHGRFLEILLTHFGSELTGVTVTPD